MRAGGYNAYRFDGGTLRRLRQESGDDLTLFGAKTGKSAFMIRRYETDDVVPSAEIIACMASVLGVEPGVFFVRVTSDPEPVTADPEPVTQEEVVMT
jgi:transcriptional regulator with XRE-family HTH domain